MSSIATITAVAGAGASLYGSAKQAKATKKANAANKAAQDEENRLAWANYLMTRGLDPSGAVTGQIPQNAKAINSRLPLWANAEFATGPKPGWRRRAPVAAAPAAPTTPTTPTYPTAGGYGDYYGGGSAGQQYLR